MFKRVSMGLSFVKSDFSIITLGWLGGFLQRNNEKF